MTTLVTGATGLIGRCVLRHLCAAGEDVRALTRHPESAHLPTQVEVFGGDLEEPSSLGPALRGIDRLFLIAVPATVEEVVGLAAAAGVQRIVDLSSGAVTHGMDAHWHLPVEQAIERSGVAWTHIRPGEFANNTAILWGASIRAERAVHFPRPDHVKITPVHEADVADVAGTALLADGHHGVAYTLTGPGRTTPREQVADISAVLGEPVRFDEVTAEEAVHSLRDHDPYAATVAEVVLGLRVIYPTAPAGQTDHNNGPARAPLPPEPTPEVIEQVTGRPARTFQEWAADHIGDFR